LDIKNEKTERFSSSQSVPDRHLPKDAASAKITRFLTAVYTAWPFRANGHFRHRES